MGAWKTPNNRPSAFRYWLDDNGKYMPEVQDFFTVYLQTSDKTNTHKRFGQWLWRTRRAQFNWFYKNFWLKHPELWPKT